MPTVSRFATKFASVIVCTLHCFDRVIFKGHLAMASAKELERFIDYVLQVRRPHLSVPHRFLQEGPVGRKPHSTRYTSSPAATAGSMTIPSPTIYKQPGRTRCSQSSAATTAAKIALLIEQFRQCLARGNRRKNRGGRAGKPFSAMARAGANPGPLSSIVNPFSRSFAFAGRWRQSGRISTAGGAGPRLSWARLPGNPAFFGWPAGCAETRPRRRWRTPLTCPTSAHAHRSALFRSRIS